MSNWVKTSGKSKMPSIFARSISLAVLSAFSLMNFGCSPSEEFVSGQITESFVQDFNPKYLEVLWVVDDRSPMYNARTQIVSEATKFFTAIDGIASRYRMGLVSTDMQFAQGALQPRGSGFILDESYRQTSAERAVVFSDLLGGLINLKTGYQSRGLEAAVAALQGEFVTQANVPLVLVFISYGEDESVLPTGQTDAVAYYKSKFIELKGGNADLVRTYAVNYKPLPSGIGIDTPEAAPHRCAQLYHNEIDENPGTYEDRYFNLSTAMGGYNADLCEISGFSSQLNLNGMTLKELAKRFLLKSKPNPDTIRITIVRKNGSAAPIPTWSYNLPTNEIVFDTTPEEGTSIVVQYLPAGK